jgi:hypothetical protein
MHRPPAAGRSLTRPSSSVVATDCPSGENASRTMESPEMPRARRGGRFSGTGRGTGSQASRIANASRRPTRRRFQNLNRVQAVRPLIDPVSGRLETASRTDASLRIEQFLTTGWATTTDAAGRWRLDSPGEEGPARTATGPLLRAFGNGLRSGDSPIPDSYPSDADPRRLESPSLWYAPIPRHHDALSVELRRDARRDCHAS